jgi:hypothetical protein
MKIIIDECVPYIVKKGLTQRQIKTVREMGWSGIQNGELLRLVNGEFDIFITSDKNLRYQQNLENVNLSIILLPSNQVPVVKGLLSQIDDAISSIKPGNFIEIA